MRITIKITENHLRVYDLNLPLLQFELQMCTNESEMKEKKQQ